MKSDLAPAPGLPALCTNEHTALKQDDIEWGGALLVGYQPYLNVLGEHRHCPICQSTVWRPVSLKKAMGQSISLLLEYSPPNIILLRSVWMLKSLSPSAVTNVVTPGQNPSEPPTDFDWPSFGRKLRDRRHDVGLTRARFSQLGDFDAMELQRVETGKWVPSVKMLKKLLGLNEHFLPGLGNESRAGC